MCETAIADVDVILDLFSKTPAKLATAVAREATCAGAEIWLWFEGRPKESDECALVYVNGSNRLLVLTNDGKKFRRQRMKERTKTGPP